MSFRLKDGGAVIVIVKFILMEKAKLCVAVKSEAYSTLILYVARIKYQNPADTVNLITLTMSSLPLPS